MDVSIIIVNYRTVGLIIDAIQSIHVHTQGIQYEIIVVDNFSGDNSKAILEGRFGPDGLTYVALPSNAGFGAANNEGLKYAKGDFVFFLNPDTIIMNEAIGILMDFLRQNDKVGAVSANLYTREITPAYSYSRLRPGIFNEEFRMLTRGIVSKIIPCSHHNSKGNPLRVEILSGADMMVKRSVLNEVGSFDDSFFMYYEDADLCCRIKKVGYLLMNIPQAKIIHLESQSIQIPDSKLMLSLDSRFRYYQKHKGILYFKIAWFIHLFTLNFNIFFSYIFNRDYSYYIRYKSISRKVYRS